MHQLKLYLTVIYNLNIKRSVGSMSNFEAKNSLATEAAGVKQASVSRFAAF